jgi:hypothetical protein
MLVKSEPCCYILHAINYNPTHLKAIKLAQNWVRRRYLFDESGNGARALCKRQSGNWSISHSISWHGSCHGLHKSAPLAKRDEFHQPLWQGYLWFPRKLVFRPSERLVTSLITHYSICPGIGEKGALIIAEEQGISVIWWGWLFNEIGWYIAKQCRTISVNVRISNAYLDLSSLRPCPSESNIRLLHVFQ